MLRSGLLHAAAHRRLHQIEVAGHLANTAITGQTALLRSKSP
jgi:hypothetical protein